MADSKISALTALTGTSVDTTADVLPIVDTSVTTTKKILVSELLIALGTTTSAATSTTFTFDGAGGTTGSVTLSWQKMGSWVLLNIPAASATSGTGSTYFLSNTAIAAAVRPAAAQVYQGVPIVSNNAATTSVGYVVINTNGTIQIYRDATGTAFTNSATAGLGSATSIFYFIG